MAAPTRRNIGLLVLGPRAASGPSLRFVCCSWRCCPRSSWSRRSVVCGPWAIDARVAGVAVGAVAAWRRTPFAVVILVVAAVTAGLRAVALPVPARCGGPTHRLATRRGRRFPGRCVSSATVTSARVRGRHGGHHRRVHADGLHLGHRALIEVCRQAQARLGLDTAVVTFLIAFADDRAAGVGAEAADRPRPEFSMSRRTTGAFPARRHS